VAVPEVAQMTAQRMFTDRRDAVAAFRRSLLELSDAHARVLNFHGVGGIGKSRLLEELHRACVVDGLVLAVTLDFELPDFRHEDGALSQLRYLFRREHKIGFPLFDIAFTVYRSKTQPNVPLADQQVALLTDSEVLATILDVAGATPLVGHVVSLLKVLERAGRRGARFAHVRQDEDLQRLDACSPLEVLHALATFLGRDLARHVANAKLAPVVFLDSYEALTRDATTTDALTERTEWLERLVRSLPGALIVIASREPIDHYHDVQYVDLVTRHPLTDLSRTDCVKFLRSAGIEDPGIARRITVASEGLPFYLQVAADHWGLARPDRRPSSEEFGAEPAALMHRFTGHLQDGERELLTLMSVPRRWDRELCRALARWRGLSQSAQSWQRLSCYSFTSATPAGAWRMHQLMRRTLLAQLEDDEREEIDGWLHQYYRAKVDESVDASSRIADFGESAYHGVRAGSLDALWLLDVGCSLMDRGLWSGMAGVVAEIRVSAPERAVASGGQLEAVLGFFEGWILRQQGKLQDAQQALRAVDVATIPSGATRIRYQLAHVERESGETAAAGAIYAELFDPLLAGDVDELGRMSAINYSDIRYVQGHFREAAGLLQRLSGVELSAGCEGEMFRILGHIYRFSELRQQALEHYETAHAVFSLSRNKPGIAQAQTNLAEALALIAPRDALDHATKAIEGNSDLGAQLEVGKAWNAMGHAYLVLGERTQARRAASEAVRNQEEVGYQTGLARALLTTAFVMVRDRDPDAQKTAEQAIELFETTDTYPTCIVILSKLLRGIDQARSVEASEAGAWERIEPLDSLRDLGVRLDSAIGRLLEDAA
jgi:tetratricopeptide (TPR) repeat protein